MEDCIVIITQKALVKIFVSAFYSGYKYYINGEIEIGKDG